MDIDKILDIIKRKVLKGMHLALTIKEVQAGYLSSPYFKGSVSISVTKQVTKEKIFCKESQNIGRMFCPTRFLDI